VPASRPSTRLCDGYSIKRQCSAWVMSVAHGRADKKAARVKARWPPGQVPGWHHDHVWGCLWRVSAQAIRSDMQSACRPLRLARAARQRQVLAAPELRQRSPGKGQRTGERSAWATTSRTNCVTAGNPDASAASGRRDHITMAGCLVTH